MITGEQLRQAREKANLTQESLADAVGVSMRSVGNWERGEGVPRGKEGKVRMILAGHLDPQHQGNALASVSDVALLAELARRLGAKEKSWSAGDTLGPEDDGAAGGSVVSFPPPTESGGAYQDRAARLGQNEGKRRKDAQDQEEPS